MKILIIILAFSLFGCRETTLEKDNKTNIPLSKAMGDFYNDGFTKAIKPIDFKFPEDHGPHNNFKTEWWYFTGNLQSSDKKEYGFQFTIFRNGISSKKPKRNSKWSSNQMYMGHFALTDISNKEFYFEERFSREGNNLAGANIQNGFRVWIEDWDVSQTGDSIFFDLPLLNISAEMKNVKIDLKLKAVKDKTLQGNNGLSQKGSEKGNASYYYSYTRLKTKGTISVENIQSEVQGYSWMDREWSTSALAEDQIGWDWFSIQLNDNTELMYYQMRKKDGTPDIFSKGVFITQIGKKLSFGKEDINLTTLDYWQSPLGNNYPSGWKLSISSLNLNLTILPALKNQLMDVSVKYWEGAVFVNGKKNEADIKGKGYVELTGY